MGNSLYHGMKDRRQRPAEQGIPTGYALLGLSLLASGVLGCFLFFSGVFTGEEVLLNIAPQPIVQKAYAHPKSCLDAGTSLFKVSGSQRLPITEIQLLKVGTSLERNSRSAAHCSWTMLQRMASCTPALYHRHYQLHAFASLLLDCCFS